MIGLGPEGSFGNAWQGFGEGTESGGYGILNAFAGGLFDPTAGAFYDPCRGVEFQRGFEQGQLGGRVAIGSLGVVGVLEGTAAYSAARFPGARWLSQGRYLRIGESGTRGLTLRLGSWHIPL